jgi:hypothetical protein
VCAELKRGAKDTWEEPTRVGAGRHSRGSSDAACEGAGGSRGAEVFGWGFWRSTVQDNEGGRKRDGFW